MRFAELFRKKADGHAPAGFFNRLRRMTGHRKHSPEKTVLIIDYLCAMNECSLSVFPIFHNNTGFFLTQGLRPLIRINYPALRLQHVRTAA